MTEAGTKGAQEALLASAHAYLERGAAFLQKTELLPLLQSHGRVEFTGSYRLGLMTRNDLDLVLVVEQPSFDLVVNLVGQLRARGFNNYWLFDNLAGGWPEDPRHIICEAWYGFYDTRAPEEDRWSVGIAICSPDEANRVLQMTHKVEQAIAEQPALRGTILELKHALAKKHSSKRFTGTEIYTAVIDRGAQTAEEIERLYTPHVTSGGTV